MDIVEWKEAVEEWRRQKDAYFADSHESPIPAADKSKFNGLDYFPIDQGLRFEAKIREHDEKETFEVEDSGGNVRNFIRWGEFQFKIGDDDCTLQAYKSEPDEEGLFVPFRDGSSGNETYGAGRYLDLDPIGDKTPDGKWILDFNKAYSPLCAYNENYACPLAPMENWLDVPINAGEKNYPLK